MDVLGFRVLGWMDAAAIFCKNACNLDVAGSYYGNLVVGIAISHRSLRLRPAADTCGTHP
jgi:hypothetical protein